MWDWFGWNWEQILGELALPRMITRSICSKRTWTTMRTSGTHCGCPLLGWLAVHWKNMWKPADHCSVSPLFAKWSNQTSLCKRPKEAMVCRPVHTYWTMAKWLYFRNKKWTHMDHGFDWNSGYIYIYTYPNIHWLIMIFSLKWWSNGHFWW